MPKKFCHSRNSFRAAFTDAKDVLPMPKGFCRQGSFVIIKDLALCVNFQTEISLRLYVGKHIIIGNGDGSLKRFEIIGKCAIMIPTGSRIQGLFLRGPNTPLLAAS